MIETLYAYRRVALAASIIWVLSACVAPVVPTPSAQFPTDSADRTFAAGFLQISERYIDPLPPSEIALAGMTGLDTIDPALSVNRQGANVTLSAGTKPVHTFAAPADDDIDGWAQLTVDVSLAGREASPALRMAPIERIYEAVFDGAVAHLDRFSRYTGAAMAAEQRARRRGFGGIGIQYRWTEAGAIVKNIIPDSPAERAGIHVGDVVTHVEGETIVGRTQEEFRERLRGPINGQISIAVLREGVKDLLPFSLTRRRIFIPTVTVDTKDGIVVAHVTGFNSHTARQLAELYHAAERTSVEPIRGVVMDLRGNPGGLLRQAVYVADLFLRQGQIVSTRGRHPESIHDYSARRSDLAAGLPLVVIVNGRSASSAEIVASALQDHNRAIVVGSTSYGKGTVQTVARLPNDGELTLTWSRFITPSGYLLHGLGVAPTVCTNGKGDARALIAAALDHEEETAHLIAQWRTVPFADHLRRERLRAACPGSAATRHVDIDVAKLLIKERGLYHRVSTGPLSIASTAK